jgi:hypothetical protein
MRAAIARRQRDRMTDYFRYWHISELAVPMCDVRSWGKTGNGQRWCKPTRLTPSGHAPQDVHTDDQHRPDEYTTVV